MKKLVEFEVIAPPIYDAFNWDMDLIMKALEYLRQELPKHLPDFPSCSNYYLIAYGDFLGNSYSAIGVDFDDAKDLLLPNFFDLYDKVNILITEVMTIEKIRSASKDLIIISWDVLKEQGYYPKK
ncbi:hypothetical protein [Lewinella cohaerens]|uniref:hypothetical protein n=1 Tax=Lewinella cohaerens TaxID=70995 RepID=UPI00036EC68B|nr:hypothetical protein [Lewinella cohaerens]